MASICVKCNCISGYWGSLHTASPCDYLLFKSLPQMPFSVLLSSWRPHPLTNGPGTQIYAPRIPEGRNLLLTERNSGCCSDREIIYESSPTFPGQLKIRINMEAQLHVCLFVSIAYSYHEEDVWRTQSEFCWAAQWLPNELISVHHVVTFKPMTQQVV